MLVTGLLLGACGEPLAPPQPVALRLTASDTMVATGGTLQFSAAALDSAGTPVPGVVILWSVSAPSRGSVSPVGVFTALDSGLVYVRALAVGAALADSVAVRVMAPGTVKWTWAAAEAGGWMPTIGGPALGLDGSIYVLVEYGDWTQDYPATLVALTRGGNVKWEAPLIGVIGNYPVVTPTEGQVWIVGSYLYLFAASGVLLWDSVTPTNASLHAGAATDAWLIAAQGKQLAVYAATNHGRLWESATAPLQDWLVPPTITREGHVLAKHTADTLFVFDGADGRILRFFLDPDTSVDKRVFGTGSVPTGDRYYLPTTERLAGLDTAGPLLWLTEEAGRGMPEPAVAPDGTLYVQNSRWGLQALNPDGTTKWYRRRVGPPGQTWVEDPRWPWYGGPALGAGGIIYGAGYHAFFAYDAAGRLFWTYAADSAGTPQAFEGAPAIAPDGTIYTWTSTHVYAFWGSAPPEPNSPWPMWRHDAQRTGWAGYKAK